MSDSPTPKINLNDPAIRRRLGLLLGWLGLIVGIACIVVTIAAGGGPVSRGVVLGVALALWSAIRLFALPRLPHPGGGER